MEFVSEIGGEMGLELSKVAKRSLVAKVDQLEATPSVSDFTALFDELMAFGWREIDAMADGDLKQADLLLNHLLFVLGEETLSGALGVAVVCDLLARRILALGSVVSKEVMRATVPVFMDPDRIGEVLRVDRVNGRLVVNGALDLVPAASIAETLVVPLHDGVGIEIPLKDATVSDPVETLGLRGCPLSDIHFHGLAVPKACEIVNLNGDFVWRSARIWLLGLTAGIFSGGVNRAIDYAKERYQGGDVIYNHSGLRSIISRLQTTAWNAKDVARMGDEPSVFRQRFGDAMESLVERGEDIIQVLGGYGYMEEFVVERVFRDVTHLGGASLGRRGFDRVGHA